MPYTYLIGWSNHNKWYYGSKLNSTPDLFWVKYFTSSKDVKRLRSEVGEPDIIEIRKIFTEKSDAVNWEKKVIRRIKAVYSDNWLNRSPGGMLNVVKAYTKSGKSITTTFDDPLFKSGEIIHYNKGYGVFLDDNDQPIRCSLDFAKSNNLYGVTKYKHNGENNPFYNKKHSNETKNKMRGPRPTFKPWNAGITYEPSDKFMKAIENRNYIKENNPVYGRRWLRNDKLKLKAYIKDKLIIEKLLNEGWEHGTRVKQKYKNITKELEKND